ncbi:unnamed protein product [Mytilus coruscus]|uniref:Ectoine hydroxylase n=1 Tax=Mytilus coruscus TaxID=42192 RepID=A0A6J8EKL2_MYTCO|nr:unnamed protein product [Mytilus coruscus]
MTDYRCSPGGFVFEEAMKKDFLQCGYIMIRNLLDQEEVKKIRTSLENSEDLQKNAFGVDDDNGKTSKLVIWKHPGNDVTGMLGRCEKVVSTCEKLLDGEVYHYHTKLMMKEPFTGGSFIWHQDYGYWYHNGFLTPDMMTVFFHLDKCIKENGCLEVPDSAIRECTNLDCTGKDFMDPKKDNNIKYTEDKSKAS